MWTAFEALFRQHQRAVYGWILRITRNPAAAEDLTIETFWRIHRACTPALIRRMGFEGWARRIATRVALDWLRARRAENELSFEACAELAAPAEADAAMTAEIRLKTALAFATSAAEAANCGHAGGDRGAAAKRSGRGAGNFGCSRQTARLSRASLAQKRLGKTRNHAMNEHDRGPHEEALATGPAAGCRRRQSRHATCGPRCCGDWTRTPPRQPRAGFNWVWFDGALAAGLVALAAFFPASIPVLLYYL